MNQNKENKELAKQNWKNYYTKELQKINMDQNPIGQIMLKFLDDMNDHLNGDYYTFQRFLEKLERVGNLMPLSPLEEKDFSTKIVEGQVFKCSDRYDSVYQAEDGNWYDDKAVCFVNATGHRMFIYQGNTSSKRKITMPYYPDPEVRTIEE